MAGRKMAGSNYRLGSAFVRRGVEILISQGYQRYSVRVTSNLLKMISKSDNHAPHATMNIKLIWFTLHGFRHQIIPFAAVTDI
jgi:hypothetical protein